MTVFRWIVALLVCALVAFVAMAALKPHDPPPVEVRAVVATRGKITSTVRAAGKLEPVDKVNVSSNITGILLDLRVGIGSVVKKGQYLGQIDTSRYRAAVDGQRASLAAAEADVRKAQADLARLKNVAGRIGSAPAAMFNVSEREQAATNLADAEAGLASLEARAQSVRAQLASDEKNLEWATLRAPVDGTVLSTNHRVGERIRGSDFSEDVVLVLGSLSKMEARIDVGEHDVVRVHQGQKATITIDALPKVTLDGEVIDRGDDAVIKNPGTDNEVTSFPVWVTMNNPPAEVLSGMSAQVTIYTDTRDNAVEVPIQAVTVRPRDTPGATTTGGDGNNPLGDRLQKVVFVVKDDHVEKRVVETGISSESSIEIVKGLEAGETVVEGPYRVLARDLKDGNKVAVEKPDGEGGPGKDGDKPKEARK